MDEKAVKEFPFLEGMGEAGGVAFTTIRHSRYTDDGYLEVLEVNLTGRGRNTREAMENLVDAINHAKEKGWEAYKQMNRMPAKTASKQPAVLSSLPAPEQPAVSAPVATVPAPAITSVPLVPVNEPLERGESKENLLHATKMVVTPRADGKVSLGFFEPGHKYADITKICTVEQAIATLRPLGGFTAEHFRAVATYDAIAAKVVWVESDKLNTAGKPYKNIVSISAG